MIRPYEQARFRDRHNVASSSPDSFILCTENNARSQSHTYSGYLPSYSDESTARGVTILRQELEITCVACQGYCQCRNYYFRFSDRRAASCGCARFVGLSQISPTITDEYTILHHLMGRVFLSTSCVVGRFCVTAHLKIMKAMVFIAIIIVSLFFIRTSFFVIFMHLYIDTFFQNKMYIEHNFLSLVLQIFFDSCTSLSITYNVAQWDK
jgi:hypothetical protein